MTGGFTFGGTFIGVAGSTEIPQESRTRGGRIDSLRLKGVGNLWRLCDLHIHTTPNEQDSSQRDAGRIVSGCLDAGLDVIAIADHDHVEAVEAVIGAADETSLVVVPGVEVSTDRGHVVALVPGPAGVPILRDLLHRVGAAPGLQVPFTNLIDVVRNEQRPNGDPFSVLVILVGGHVDQPGSLLAADQSLSVPAQINDAEELHAIEVTNSAIRTEWTKTGIKQQGRFVTVIEASDCHAIDTRADRATWIYLPDIDVRSLRHALATPEASVRFETPPNPPTIAIEEFSIAGGLYDGLLLRFCERVNAIIGPPSSGKSLVLDAIRWVFNLECDIEEIAKTAESRLGRCLPADTVVSVKGRTSEGPFELQRIRGGATPPTPPFKPIVFSQTELVRRAMENSPSMSLLDIHCPDAGSHHRRAAELSGEVEDLLTGLVEKARRAKELTTVIANPADGLTATRTALDRLAGTEPAAKISNDISRVRGWRGQVRDAVEDWRNRVQPPSGPSVLQRPQLETDRVSADQFMPSEKIQEAVKSFGEKVAAAAEEAAVTVSKLLDDSESQFADLQSRADQALAEGGFEAGEEVLARLQELRRRLVDLEKKEVELDDAQTEIDRGLADVIQRVRDCAQCYSDLRDARKEACRVINASMRACFARVLPGADSSEIDRLLEDVKTGTKIWSSSLPTIRDTLNRERVAEAAVRLAEGRSDKLGTDEDLRDQDAIIDEALRRGKVRELAFLATTFPEDMLDLAMKGDNPKPFRESTEGLRALAIKEISFAASSLPVITDQPEDAVPSRAVFDTLVPTIREQRAERQFILASHDANIVVAGDAERVWVFGEETPIEGSLFDDVVRRSSLELLEGGEEAFALRSRRYKSAI